MADLSWRGKNGYSSVVTGNSVLVGRSWEKRRRNGEVQAVRGRKVFSH